MKIIQYAIERGHEHARVCRICQAQDSFRDLLIGSTVKHLAQIYNIGEPLSGCSARSEQHSTALPRQTESRIAYFFSYLDQIAEFHQTHGQICDDDPLVRPAVTCTVLPYLYSEALGKLPRRQSMVVVR